MSRLASWLSACNNTALSFTTTQVSRLALLHGGKGTCIWIGNSFCDPERVEVLVWAPCLWHIDHGVARGVLQQVSPGRSGVWGDTGLPPRPETLISRAETQTQGIPDT